MKAPNCPFCGSENTIHRMASWAEPFVSGDAVKDAYYCLNCDKRFDKFDLSIVDKK